EFLGDPRVVDTNRLLWLPILHGYVLRQRPPKTTAAYEKIWTDEGSPLLVIARRQAKAVQKKLDAELDRPAHVALAMRYGQPSLEQGLSSLRDAGCQQVLILPMYPQYSAATSATTFDKIGTILTHRVVQPALRTLPHYHTEPAYIDALATS